jgi:hypothetical protein
MSRFRGMSHPSTCECLHCEQERFNITVTRNVTQAMKALDKEPAAKEVALQLLKDGWTGTIDELVEVSRRLSS